MVYEVRTPVFEGPFELLLHLIVREQVDVYEVSVAAIVDAYLVELDALRASAAPFDLDMATEFLLVAATLLELKARRLLPVSDPVELDDELAPWEERDLLLAHLFECATFRAAADVLSRLEAEAGRSIPRRAGLEERFVALAPDLLAGVTAAELRAAFLRACASAVPPRVDLHHIQAIRASVTEAVAELIESLPGAGVVSFRGLTDSLDERLEVVVRFLALLELFKRGLVDLRQAGSFADIEVAWIGGTDRPVAAQLGGVDAFEGREERP